MPRKEWLPNHPDDNLSHQGAEDKILLSASSHGTVERKHGHLRLSKKPLHSLTCSLPPALPSWMTSLADLRIYLAARGNPFGYSQWWWWGKFSPSSILSWTVNNYLCVLSFKQHSVEVTSLELHYEMSFAYFLLATFFFFLCQIGPEINLQFFLRAKLLLVRTTKDLR